MIKVAIFSDCFVPQVNGIVTSLFNLAAGLADAGHSVSIVAPKYAKRHAEFEHPGVRVLRMPSAPAMFYPDYRITLPFDLSVFGILKEEGGRPHAFRGAAHGGPRGYRNGQAAQGPDRGDLPHLHCRPPIPEPRLPHEKLQKFAWDYCNFYYNRCDLVTTPSEYTKRQLIGHGCSRPISVISNGIDVSTFDNSKAEEFRPSMA